MPVCMYMHVCSGMTEAMYSATNQKRMGERAFGSEVGQNLRALHRPVWPFRGQ